MCYTWKNKRKNGVIMAKRILEDEFEKIRREHMARDAASPEGKQKALEESMDKTSKLIKEGKTSPGEPDYGPLPEKGIMKGLEMGGGKNILKLLNEKDTLEKAKQKTQSDMLLQQGVDLFNSKNMKKGGLTKSDARMIAKKEVKKHEKSMHGMKRGGTASSRADGIAQRGKTRGKIV